MSEQDEMIELVETINGDPPTRGSRATSPGWISMSVRARRALTMFVQATFVASTVLVSPIASAPVSAAPPTPGSASLDQCANGSDILTRTSGCATTASEWVNGNLGASKSAYKEGDSIPYRMTFGNLAIGGTHTVTIEWDTTKASKHAIDYLTTYNRTVANANPCLGVSGCVYANGIPSAALIPTDPQVDNGSGSPITQAPGVFTIWGGSITNFSDYSYSSGAGFVGDKSASIVISFTASVANPVLAWGGHIATRLDWGLADSAVTISGSPYHTRLLDLDGSGGNQDRSLSAGAVFFPASITIVKAATPEGSTSFAFTGSPAPLTAFNLLDDGNVANNTKVFSNILAEATFTVNETPIPAGWAFDSIACSVTSPNSGSFNISTTTVNIVLKEGENWTCTYTNHLRTATLTLVKTVVNDSGGTLTVSDFPLFISGTAAISGTAYTLNAGAYTASETNQPGYTAGSWGGDCAADGSITLALGDAKTCTITNDDIPQRVGQITPTATTCTSFNAGTAATLTELNYSIKAGNVAAVNPGVFFYWIKVTAVAGSNTFTITQTQNDAFAHFFSQASGSFVYTSPSCTKVSIQNITTTDGVTTVTFTAPSAGTYIIGIKYDSKNVQGFPAPSGDVIYTFTTGGVPGSNQDITLKHP